MTEQNEGKLSQSRPIRVGGRIGRLALSGPPESKATDTNHKRKITREHPVGNMAKRRVGPTLFSDPPDTERQLLEVVKAERNSPGEMIAQNPRWKL